MSIQRIFIFLAISIFSVFLNASLRKAYAFPEDARPSVQSFICRVSLEPQAKVALERLRTFADMILGNDQGDQAPTTFNLENVTLEMLVPLLFQVKDGLSPDEATQQLLEQIFSPKNKKGTSSFIFGDSESTFLEFLTKKARFVPLEDGKLEKVTPVYVRVEPETVQKLNALTLFYNSQRTQFLNRLIGFISSSNRNKKIIDTRVKEYKANRKFDRDSTTPTVPFREVYIRIPGPERRLFAQMSIELQAPESVYFSALVDVCFEALPLDAQELRPLRERRHR